MKNLRPLLYLSIILFTLSNCNKSSVSTPPVVVVTDTTSAPFRAPFVETFESGVKTDYTPGTISLLSGKWSFDNAVIGTTANDKKNGAKSVRISGAGKVSMNFDITAGIYSIIVRSAVYGTDAASTWELWASTNGGVTYAQAGVTITNSNAALRSDTFIISATGNIRFSLRKTSGGSNQINIDDVQATLAPVPPPPPPPATNDDDNMLMGNPSNASVDVNNPLNYLINQTYYAESYNRDEGKPNWVSWHLMSSDVGSVSRQDDFRADNNSLPFSWYHVSDISYSGSGFDRGHNCPSGDRTSTVTANSATFLMTNMMPQAPNNNQVTWANLEDYCRTLVSGGNECFIICGSYGVGGSGSAGSFNTIDNGHVTVPSFVWKVVVVIPNGNNDLARVTTTTRVISVIVPNVNNTNSNWKVYRTSVDAIEAATGYNLLSNVSTSIQNVIEATVDNL